MKRFKVETISTFCRITFSQKAALKILNHMTKCLVIIVALGFKCCETYHKNLEMRQPPVYFDPLVF